MLATDCLQPRQACFPYPSQWSTRTISPLAIVMPGRGCHAVKRRIAVAHNHNVQLQGRGFWKRRGKCKGKLASVKTAQAPLRSAAWQRLPDKGPVSAMHRETRFPFR